jgi:hypothetical protein
MDNRSIARDSHYVPQAMLKRWSSNAKDVFAYRTLVSYELVPLWGRRSIRGTAFQQDLYTDRVGTEDIDAFEKFITKEFERPGIEATAKLIEGRRLTRNAWNDVTRFMLLQDRRTPESYLEQTQWWHEELPALLERTLTKSIAELESGRRQPGTRVVPRSTIEFSSLFRFETRRPCETNTGTAEAGLSVVIGRKLWLASLRHALNGVVEKLLGIHWSVREPAGSEEWPLTDNPVIRLNYRSPGNFDFNGGWGNRGTEIMMPISPRHLLYAKVGERNVPRLRLGAERTRQLQAVIALHAHRWIFARRPLDWVATVRKRQVDAVAFDDEQKFWAQWQKNQVDAQQSS